MSGSGGPTGARRMDRGNLIAALVVAAGALVSGVITAVGITAGRPDFLVAVLFVVLAAATVDGFKRGRVTGRHSSAYPLSIAVFGAAIAIAMLAVGATVSGAVLLAVAVGAAVLYVLETRRPRGQEPDPPADPPAGPSDAPR